MDVFIKQQCLDTTSPMGKLLFQITSAFAEFERHIDRNRLERAASFVAELYRLSTSSPHSWRRAASGPFDSQILAIPLTRLINRVVIECGKILNAKQFPKQVAQLAQFAKKSAADRVIDASAPAPTRLWDLPRRAPSRWLRAYRELFEDHDLRVA